MQDQMIVLSERELNMFKTVDEAVERSVVAGDPQIAVELAGEILRGGHIRGLALAKLLYSIRARWNIFQAAGVEDDFENYMYIHTGRSIQTISKYARMWESIFENPEIPENIKQQLMGRDIKDLLLLTAMVREGAEPEVLEKVAVAADGNEVRDIVRKERGEATSSKTALRIYYQVRNGDAFPPGTLFLKNNGNTIIGTLNNESGDPYVEKAINRILNSAGIVEVL